jgi:hypothetical protein
MADRQAEKPTPELVDRRLRELEQLYELGQVLREVRFVDPPERPQSSRPDRVRERPDERGS